MEPRTRLRLGTLLWFALLGATIALTLHQRRMASRLGELVERQRSLDAEAGRLADGAAALVERLDPRSLDRRIRQVLVAERTAGLPPEEGPAAPAFSRSELRQLWDLDQEQADAVALALEELRSGLPGGTGPALDRFEARCADLLDPPRRAAIRTWRQGLEAALAKAGP